MASTPAAKLALQRDSLGLVKGVLAAALLQAAICWQLSGYSMIMHDIWIDSRIIHGIHRWEIVESPDIEACSWACEACVGFVRWLVRVVATLSSIKCPPAYREELFPSTKALWVCIFALWLTWRHQLYENSLVLHISILSNFPYHIFMTYLSVTVSHLSMLSQSEAFERSNRAQGPQQRMICDSTKPRPQTIDLCKAKQVVAMMPGPNASQSSLYWTGTKV